MRKPYATYEDYKEDPDNLDTNELVRIEQTLLALQVPPTFKDRKELFRFAFHDLKFPGYGLSTFGGKDADDSSKLEGIAVEIPQRNRDRILVFHEYDRELKLVDDFVEEGLTNQIRGVILERRKLRYRNDSGQLVREKEL